MKFGNQQCGACTPASKTNVRVYIQKSLTVLERPPKFVKGNCLMKAGRKNT